MKAKVKIKEGTKNLLIDEIMNHECTYELEKELYYYCVLSTGYERFVIKKENMIKRSTS